MNSPDGFCEHGQLHCPRCRKAAERSTSWGVYLWAPDGRYPKSAAVRVYRLKAHADRLAARTPGNYVVRSA